MSYKQLYEFAQTLTPKISRKTLKDKTLEVTGIPAIAQARTAMDLTVSRGFYLTPQNETERIVQQLGKHVIVTARDLNYCWERFVYVKELMHAFGTADKMTDNGEKFEALLSDFSVPNQEMSPQMSSELDAFWMALGVLCPETIRQSYAKMRAAQEIDDYSIALELRIPEGYVPRLFETRYKTVITRLTE